MGETGGIDMLRSTLLDDGTIAESPQSLANAAGVGLETYSLARVIASEAAGGDPVWHREAIGWAVINRAKQLGQSIFSVLSYRTGVGQTNTYGAQTQRRYAATSRDPKEVDVATAVRLLTGKVPDPTSGAQKFLHVRTQSSLSQSRGDHKPPEVVFEKWAAEGYYPVVVNGIDPNYLLFFRKGKLPDKPSIAIASTLPGGALFLFGGAIVWSAYQVYKRFSSNR